jgi:hypothetical protein
MSITLEEMYFSASCSIFFIPAFHLFEVYDEMEHSIIKSEIRAKVECLPSKSEALSSNPMPHTQKKE